MKSLFTDRLITRITKVLLTVFIICLTDESFASHYMGGEIRWECLPNGNYRFIVRAYRECAGITYSYTINLDHNIPAANIPSSPGYILLNLYPNTQLGRTDISPQCFDSINPSVFPHITCATTNQPNTGGVEEYYYTSDQSFPNGVMIGGTPPASGYVFSISICNRNDCQNIISSSSYCTYLRAIMYPFNGQNVNPCWDNSPLFAERPQTVIAAGNPIAYNPTAYDMDGDSLGYSWAQPYDTENFPITNYYPGFSYTNPLPGPSANPNNIAATLDTVSGQITFTSFTTGAFLTKYKVSAYRGQVKVAEIEREMQVVIVATDANLPPVTSLPFPQSANPYVDTVYFGTLVNFPFYASDSGFLNGGMLYQNLTLDINGAMMGTNDTCACGCPVPPCAHLDVPTPIHGALGVGANFSWQTTVDHLIFGGLQIPYVDYYFVFKAKDDFCPVPAITMVPFKIVVKDIVLPAPVLQAYAVNNVSGDVTINWIPVQNDTTNSFRYYLIYYKNLAKTDFQVIDTVFDINQSSFTHPGAIGLSQYFWYMVKTVSGHAGAFSSGPSNILTNYTIGVSENETEKFNLFYDPTYGGIRLSNIPIDCDDMTLEIYNVLGQNILRKEITSMTGSGNIILFNAKPGMYLYRLSSGSFLIHGKIQIN